MSKAFELPWEAQLPAGQAHLLHGRSWSGRGPIRQVEVSTDGGGTWQRAKRFGPNPPGAWQRWQVTWRPAAPGQYTLLARATDVTGAAQPDASTYNTMGYLFDAVVRHQVTVV